MKIKAEEKRDYVIITYTLGENSIDEVYGVFKHISEVFSAYLLFNAIITYYRGWRQRKIDIKNRGDENEKQREMEMKKQMEMKMKN